MKKLKYYYYKVAVKVLDFKYVWINVSTKPFNGTYMPPYRVLDFKVNGIKRHYGETGTEKGYKKMPCHNIIPITEEEVFLELL